MIKLVNGRGQLGSYLKQLESISIDKKIYIYHTWNIEDKSKNTQKKEFDKFVNFVKKTNCDCKIIFISTCSTKDNWYNYYKHLSESYLLSNTANGIVIRLPTIIGKGIFEKFKNETAKPYGVFSIVTIEDAYEFIKSCLFKNSIIRIYTLQSEIISAKIVYELIKFGKDDVH